MTEQATNTFSTPSIPTPSIPTQSPIPIPQANKETSGFTNSIKISRTGWLPEKVHLSQIALFRDQAWAYMQYIGNDRDRIAQSLQANAVTKVDYRVRMFFNSLFQLMASDNNGAAYMWSHVVNGFTASGCSVEVNKEQQVTVLTDGQVMRVGTEEGTLIVKRLTLECVERYFSLESDTVVNQRTYVIAADKQSKRSTKKHQVDLITFLGNIPFQPDDVSDGYSSTTLAPRSAAYNFLPQVAPMGRAGTSGSTSVQVDPPPAYTPYPQFTPIAAMTSGRANGAISSQLQVIKGSPTSEQANSPAQMVLVRPARSSRQIPVAAERGTASTPARQGCADV